MPTWGEILQEINKTASKTPNNTPDFDGVRRKYLKQLHKLTGRATIIYATAWLESKPFPPGLVQVHLVDVQGFMEALSNVKEKELDLLLHSPGGSAEAAQSIVEYLRQKFDHVRVFVPLAAMSAATMIALSADEIVMGKHSQLGPTDPQFNIETPEGARSAPAQAILDQFEEAKRQCISNPAAIAAWLPILRTYAPGLLTQCERSQQQAVEMVSDWLERFMFSGTSDSKQHAVGVARWFASYENFGSHGEHVGREKLQNLDVPVNVKNLEDDRLLQDAVLSVHHATMHTFSMTTATKIIENHHGRSFVRLHVPLVPLPPNVGPERPKQSQRGKSKVKSGRKK